jgi:transcription-repair coupling factor (superfamily II helicase)
MDRLICGDVGFGKTEVAMRAAVEGGRVGTPGADAGADDDPRAAALATFRDRFRDFPSSRAGLAVPPDADVEGAVAGFREGRIDILVGTHRVLSRDVVPADLGLVIVDEEQRFGVAQKELLRQLRTEVDVLALSATPIPRTLHMSLSGCATSR